MAKFSILIIAAAVGLLVPSLARAAWLVDERGYLVNEGQVLGREDDREEDDDDNNNDDEARSRTEIRDGEVRTEIRTATGERVKFRSEDGETRTEVRSGGVKVRLERSNDEVKLKMETEEGEEEDLGEQQALKIREREEENEVEIEVKDEEFVVRRGQVEATTRFPLSVNLATNELVVTTPAGERVVTVLPDQAVRSMLAANIIDQLISATASGVILDARQGLPVYQIAGVRQHRFLGFIPVQTEVTAVVSAETGELVATEDVSLVEQVIGALSF